MQQISKLAGRKSFAMQYATVNQIFFNTQPSISRPIVQSSNLILKYEHFSALKTLKEKLGFEEFRTRAQKKAIISTIFTNQNSFQIRGFLLKLSAQFKPFVNCFCAPSIILRRAAAYGIRAKNETGPILLCSFTIHFELKTFGHSFSHIRSQF